MNSWTVIVIWAAAVTAAVVGIEIMTSDGNRELDGVVHEGLPE